MMEFMGFIGLPITLVAGMLVAIVLTIVIVRRKLRERRCRLQECQHLDGGNANPAP